MLLNESTEPGAIPSAGDLLEIGSYDGRSSAFMAACLKPSERLVVCDAFEPDTEDSYPDKPSPERLRANVARVRPDVDDRLVVHQCLSRDLDLAADERFRFVHVDGGHTAQAVHGDLDLVAPPVLPAGWSRSTTTTIPSGPESTWGSTARSARTPAGRCSPT